MPSQGRFAVVEGAGQRGETGKGSSRSHFGALMDTRTKLIILALVLIVLTFMVISGALAFTGAPSN
jgi:hypothetical protein